jgi:hypothetical protein
MSPLHGVWERTGARQVGGTSLWLVFDAPSGVLVAIARCRTSLEVTRNGEGLDGKMFLEMLPCNGPLGCQDPLDPEAEWLPYPNLPPSGSVIRTPSPPPSTSLGGTLSAPKGPARVPGGGPNRPAGASRTAATS